MTASDPTPVELFDTTLRDGSQTADIHFSVDDKIRIAERLQEFGIRWIEGGWPGANPKDDALFAGLRKRRWQHSGLVAFGSTARPGHPVAEDRILQQLADSGADAVCIFGKSSELHVSQALGIEQAQNLELVHESIRWLKARMPKVFFDAEHLFDGWQVDRDYALKVLEAAASAGADALVLCDTNGGNIPYLIADVTRQVIEHFPDTSIGIHAHNDCEMGVANSIAAVRVGARHVQGTINGIGERCGNANLVSILPVLQLKMGIDCGIKPEQLRDLKPLSEFVNEMANRLPWRHQPFVGLNAFAHKGGIHVSAIRKKSSLYEHIDPKLVGNEQRVLVSDQAGRSNVIFKTAEMALGEALDPDDPAVARVVEHIKALEHQGYAFEGAEASFQLLILKAMKRFRHYFDLEGFRVIDEKRDHEAEPQSEASVRIRVGSERAHTARLGNGPINAMDRALRAALCDFYPTLADMRLNDFKVRVLSTREATRAAVRVLIECTDGVHKWGTVGVSTSMIDAGYMALVDAIEYKLLQDKVDPPASR